MAHLFTPDLSALMYAYGDVAYPHKASVDTLEDILEEYITDICHEAYRVSRPGRKSKIKVDDIKFALRNDHRILGRVEELLVLQKNITEARKQYDTSEGKLKADLDKADKVEKPKEREKSQKSASKAAQADSTGDKPRKVGRPRKQRD